MKKFISLFRLDERGMVLVTALLLVSLLSLLGTTYMMQASTDLKISANYKTSREVFYAAEGGVAHAVHELNQRLNVLNADLNIAPPTPPEGITFAEFRINRPVDFEEFTIPPLADENEDPEQRTLDSGPWAGLIAFVRPFEIVVRASGDNDASSRIVAILEDQMIPLFQFGIFYERNMEIHPGAPMSFTGDPKPRIHSNENIYLRPPAQLSLDAIITSATGIYRQRLDGTSPGSGTVRIRDGDGDWQPMTIDGDSNSPNWAVDSQSNWNGNVRTSDHGVTTLDLPMPTEQPRDILGNGTESMHAKAGLKIEADASTGNIVVTNASGNIVDVTYLSDPSDPDSPVINPISTSQNTFFDQRERDKRVEQGKPEKVSVTDIDIQALLASPAVVDALNNPPANQDAGILYISSDDTVRLTNASDLSAMGSTGLTVATDRPLYVQGNYNTEMHDTKIPPASIMADAVTVLSNAWNDDNSQNSSDPLSLRVASDTTLNAALMTGNVESTAGAQYSGGVENFPRFLENWSGENFEYSGSLVCLWESEHATGNWVYGAPIYTAPNRVWSYGMDFNNLPPGTPRVRSMRVGAWMESGMRDKFED